MVVLNGYVKIHRKLIQWGWYRNSVVKDTFLHLIFTANFKDAPWENTVIRKGQIVTSNQNLADDLGFTVQQIRTAIKKLKSTGEITSKTTNKYTLITVVNWEDYQTTDEISTSQITSTLTNEQQTNNKQITNEQQTNNNNVRRIKNDKNDKKSIEKEKNIFDGYSFSDIMQSKLTEWLNYKKEQRKPYKPTGLKSFLTIVTKNINTYGEIVVMDVIDLSMANGWQGVVWDKLKNQSKKELSVYKPDAYNYDEIERKMWENMKGDKNATGK